MFALLRSHTARHAEPVVLARSLDETVTEAGRREASRLRFRLLAGDTGG